jgi:hypothetical protein
MGSGFAEASVGEDLFVGENPGLVGRGGFEGELDLSVMGIGVVGEEDGGRQEKRPNKRKYDKNRISERPRKGWKLIELEACSKKLISPKGSNF